VLILLFVVSLPRLDAQHFVSKMQTGYLLRPSIPVVEGMKIADVGTEQGEPVYPLLFAREISVY